MNESTNIDIRYHAEVLGDMILPDELALIEALLTDILNEIEPDEVTA